MQLKFKKQDSIGQSLGKKLIKITLASIVIIFIFLLNKINFPSQRMILKKILLMRLLNLINIFIYFYIFFSNFASAEEDSDIWKTKIKI